ncbi:MAG: OmpH family outer membrane protein [Candidatus Caenarcaniphilales bacterium]|nr:OmpH family outer membrane protein [Candidatus Caenarcaniphilales bacterium]
MLVHSCKLQEIVKGYLFMMKKLLSYILGALILFGIVVASPSTAAGEVGVIDNGKVLEQFSESQAAQKKIVAEREKLQKKFAELSESLETSLKDKSLSEAQKLQKRKEAKETLESEKKKLDLMIQSLRTDVEGKIIKAIEAEAKTQGLSMVVSKGIVFYGGKDITQQVVNRLK